ncbi:UNVERIFIED_CONTAM: hypothetical protein RMT77_013883 [Armadillidium vulgare]
MDLKVEEVKDSNENISKMPCEDEESEWMDVLGTGSLKKKILKEGITDSRPTKRDTVRINAIGRLENGTQFEELHDLVFTVGDGEVIHGLDLIVCLMDKDEESEIFMESRFAYGEKGFEPHVPPNSNVFYVVHLIDYKPEDEPESLSVQERLSIGIRKRERGNWWFKREDNHQAISCYKSAVDFLDDTSDTHGEVLPPELREILNERLKALNNMAAAQIKVEAYDVALKSLDSILKCQPDNIKALYRKGKVLGIQGEPKEGLEVLNRALALEPDSKVIQVELYKLREKARLQSESERSLYRKMLGLKPQAKKKEEEDRYPTLRGFPVKLWASIFIVLLSLMMAFKHRDTLLGIW